VDEFCYRCGRAADDVDGLPTCSAHGVLWLLRRNATSASALIVREERILLGLRAKDPWADHWETPGGHVNRGEHPADAVRREVWEELRVELAGLRLIDVIVHEWWPGQWVQNTVYLAEPVGEDFQPDGEEAKGAAWFDLNSLPTPMAKGQRERVEEWRDSR
jgi:8-oxo-dGTP diphosphatase